MLAQILRCTKKIQGVFPLNQLIQKKTFTTLSPLSLFGARSRKGPINWYRVHWTWRIVNLRQKARKSKNTHSKAAQRFRVTRWGYQHLMPRNRPCIGHLTFTAKKLRKKTSVQLLHDTKYYNMGHYMPLNRVKTRRFPWIRSPNQTRMRNIVGHSFG